MTYRARIAIYSSRAQMRATWKDPMRPLFSPFKRMLAVAAAGLVLAATIVPPDADARAGRGGSFGSRGSKTWSAPPPSATAPGAQQMQRSNTQPGAATNTPGAAQSAAQRPGMFNRGGMFGGFAGGLMAGLLGAGLFGLLSGSGLFSGLGSMASFLGLLLQIGIIFIVARLALKWWRNRQQPQTAAAGPSGYRLDAQNGGQPQSNRFDFGRSGSSGAGVGYGAASAQTTAVELEKDDFDVFEKMLGDVQEAWSNQDLSRLRSLATPEMVENFSEDLTDDASRGVVNKVTDVKLLQGDLAEVWRENGRAYATVAMRYQLKDVTEERDTGRVVDGDPSELQEATELWTFLKSGSQGRWMLSAIQQAA